MIEYTGFTDEASNTIEGQIRAVKTLGWNYLELRAVNGTNTHDLPDEEFAAVRSALEKAEIRVSCLGTNIANWGTSVENPFDDTLAILERAVRCGRQLKTTYARIMSYQVRTDENGAVLPDQMEEERFRRLRIVCDKLLENGITPVHENCFNYGGMSWKHTQKLLEAVPGLKLAFDTGNPPLQYDYSRNGASHLQNSWEFYQNVKPAIAYVHIKDAVLEQETGKELYHYPGQGAGDIQRILQDLLSSGYSGFCSIEPHMAVVYHDASAVASDEQRFTNFVEYGRRFMEIVQGITGSPA